MSKGIMMTNVTQESIELAQQLFALHDEALGYSYKLSWDDLEPNQREAWVQVAQFVEARLRAVVDVSLDLGRLMETPDHR